MTPITREDAIKFLEGACRNWSKVPRLSNDDLQDVATELSRFVASHQPPSPHLMGSAAIRKAGDAAVQKLVDRFALTHFMPDSDDLTDYLRGIVDACVKAAAEKPE